FFFSSRRRHTRFSRDWSSDVCSSDLFAYAQRNGDQVDDQGGPEPERDRDRHLVDDQFYHGPVAEEGIAEIKGGVILQHYDESFVSGFIETVPNLHLLKQFRWQAS